MKHGSVKPALRQLWTRFAGIKHVWEPNSWPFDTMPALNDELAMTADRIISITRRNLTKRFVSHAISRRLNFWIGTREEFLRRLRVESLPELNHLKVLEQVKRDRDAMQRRKDLITTSCGPTLTCEYEGLFSKEATETERFIFLNNIVSFLGFREFTLAEYQAGPATYFQADIYQWANSEIYDRLPNSREIDSTLSTNGFGSLFE
jgi:hypothetical protein